MTQWISGLIGSLGGIFTALLFAAVVAGAAMFFPPVRRLGWFLLNIIPAALLVFVGIVAVPLWRIVDFLVRRVLALLPLDRLFIGLLERLAQVGTGSIEDPVRRMILRGERREAAQAMWPEANFPDLYREVPDDVARPPFDDGRLLGGMRLSWLGDRHMTENAMRSAVRVGITAATLAFIAFTVLHLVSAVSSVSDAFGATATQGVILEQWPGQEPAPVPRSWAWRAGLAVAGPALLRAIGDLAAFLPGTAVSCIGLGLLGTLLLLRTWSQQKSAPYEWQTKDADVRWAFRSETRNLVRSTFRNQVLQATEYLKGLPSFFVGTAAGVLRARGDLSAPTPGQPLRLDQESLFQHLLVFGGTGEGKTTALIKPLVRQLLEQKHYGMYVCDAKGVLWNDLAAIARAHRAETDVVVIGTGQGQFGVNLLAGLTPTQVAGTLRSVMTQVSGGSSGDSFWPDMAANVLRNVLSVARAYSAIEGSRASKEKVGAAPYSLWWAYQAVLRPELLAEATAQLREWITAANAKLNAPTQGTETDVVKRLYPVVTSREVYDSISYLESTWRDMAKDTKSGIVANLTQLLDGFAGAQVLRERFACGSTTNTISIGEALNGKVVLNALSTVEDGLPARVVTVLLKTNLYREARKRESAYRQGASSVKPQDRPCIVVMDEVQEIVTADVTSGLSDATFWNVARSTGVAGVFATQTAAGLYQAIGKDAATNFMQQARSKVFFRTEDRETVEYACWCAGKFERNRVYDDGHRESIEYRGLIDGWDPLAPVDEDEAIRGGYKVFFSSAAALLNPQAFAVTAPQAQAAYADDGRFIQSTTSGEGGDVAQIQSMQAAAWRAEDLEREYRKSGNDLADSLTPADLIHLGRWHAFAQIQRAGAVRQDIIAVKHDFQ